MTPILIINYRIYLYPDFVPSYHDISFALFTILERLTVCPYQREARVSHDRRSARNFVPPLYHDLLNCSAYLISVYLLAALFSIYFYLLGYFSTCMKRGGLNKCLCYEDQRSVEFSFVFSIVKINQHGYIILWKRHLFPLFEVL